MSIPVYDALAKARGRGTTVALVTIDKVVGDVGVSAGAQLVVDDHHVVAGDFGMDALNTAGTELALQALVAGESQVAQWTFGHSDDAAPQVYAVAEVHHPEPAVLVLGASSLSLAVADYARAIGWRTLLVSPGGATDVEPGVEVRADDPADFLLQAPPGPQDAIVIGDPDGMWVTEVTRIALASRAFYIGIATHEGAPQMLRQLIDAGIPRNNLRRLRLPAGLDIGAQSPAERGMAIVAEILALERGREGGPRKLRWLA